MAIGATITLKNPGMLRRLAAGHSPTGKPLRDMLRNMGVRALSSMTRRLVESYEPDGYRTGLLQNSLQPGGPSNILDVSNDAAGPVVSAGSRVEYAAQMDRGGTIKPKRGKALAIPLTLQIRRSLQSPRDLDPDRSILTFLPSKGKSIGVLIDPENELGFGTAPLFALVAQVTQEPKRYIAWDADDARFTVDVLYPQFLDAT